MTRMISWKELDLRRKDRNRAILSGILNLSIGLALIAVFFGLGLYFISLIETGWTQ